MVDNSNNSVNSIFYVLIAMMVTSIFVTSWVVNGALYYPVDDPYIYLKQAANLVNGEFFSYSVVDERNNANSSLLYYFISALIIFFAKMFSNHTGAVLDASVLLNLSMNIFLSFLFVKYYYRLLLKFSFSDSVSNWVMLVVCTSLPVLYAFLSGFETGLTLTLLIVQLVLFLERRMVAFLAVTFLLSINRPENIVVNFSYVVMLLVSDDGIKNRNKVFYSIVIVGSMLIVPLMNYFITGDVRTASAARTGLRSLYATLHGIFNYFSIGYTNPDWLPLEVQGYFKYIRYVVSGSIVVVFILAFVRSVKDTSFNKIAEILKVGARFNIFATLTVVIVSYTSLPLLVASGSGEWSRYLSPTLPILYLLLASVAQNTKTAYQLLFGLNVIMLPLYMVSHINIVGVMSSIFYPAGQKINQITTSKDVVAIDSAGYLSHFVNGNVIDVYGLGTTRYMGIHGDFPKVYQQLKEDKISYAITWVTDEPRHYLDSAHYRKAFGNENVKEIYRYDVDTLTDIGSFPQSLAIFSIDHD